MSDRPDDPNTPDELPGSATDRAAGRGDGHGDGRGDRRDEPGSTAGARNATAADQEGPVREPTPLTQQIGRIAIVVLAVLFGIFAVANSQPVDFDWVFGETQVRDRATGEGQVGGVPLIVLLLVTFVIGALMGALVEWQVLRGRRARKAAKRGR